MTTSDVTFDTVLGYARQLSAKEQARLIGELAQGLVDEAPPQTKDKMAILDEIRARLQRSGHVPPTAEEVLAYIKAEHDSWDD